MTVAGCTHGPEPAAPPMAVTVTLSPAITTSYGTAVVDQRSPYSAVVSVSDVADGDTPAARVVDAESYRLPGSSYTPTFHGRVGPQTSSISQLFGPMVER